MAEYTAEQRLEAIQGWAKKMGCADIRKSADRMLKAQGTTGKARPRPKTASKSHKSKAGSASTAE